IGPLERRRRAVLGETALCANSVGDVLDRIVRRWLVCHAAMPGRAGPLHHIGIGTQLARRRQILLHIELRIVLERHAGLGIETLGPVQLVGVLSTLDEAAIAAIDRIEEAVAGEMADDLALLAIDYLIIEHVDADLVVIPRVVRRVLEVPDQLAGVDVERNDRVGVEIVAGAGLGIVLRHWISGPPDREPGRRIVGTGLPQAATTRLPGVVLVLPGLAARLARLRD